MNIVVEQGNTCTKGGVFDEAGRLIHSTVCKGEDIKGLIDIVKLYGPKATIISSVTGGEASMRERLEGKVKGTIKIFDNMTEVPLEVRYFPPETLGRDRLAATVGAACLYPDQDILVIDVGTAMTFEVVEAKGVYAGGSISPGLTTRFRALHAFTTQLPLTDEGSRELTVGHIGQTTKEAIRAGVVNGIVYEIIGYIQRMWLRYPEAIVLLTGGHANFLERLVKKELFDGKQAKKGCTFASERRFIVDGHLVLKGLNRILEYTLC
ncbi:MAG: type III pantothenate kinase [Tannerellaceae bacterium]|jgi:type III pantothenate kinase|nr:type III pantothenate kinase [Tannerellaceae bacterium]